MSKSSGGTRTSTSSGGASVLSTSWKLTGGEKKRIQGATTTAGKRKAATDAANKVADRMMSSLGTGKKVTMSGVSIKKVSENRYDISGYGSKSEKLSGVSANITKGVIAELKYKETRKRFNF